MGLFGGGGKRRGRVALQDGKGGRKGKGKAASKRRRGAKKDAHLTIAAVPDLLARLRSARLRPKTLVLSYTRLAALCTKHEMRVAVAELDFLPLLTTQLTEAARGGVWGPEVLHAILHVLILFAADETFCDELATAHSMLVFVVTQLNTIDLEETGFTARQRLGQQRDVAVLDESSSDDEGERWGRRGGADGTGGAFKGVGAHVANGGGTTRRRNPLSVRPGLDGGATRRTAAVSRNVFSSRANVNPPQDARVGPGGGGDGGGGGASARSFASAVASHRTVRSANPLSTQAKQGMASPIQEPGTGRSRHSAVRVTQTTVRPGTGGMLSSRAMSDANGSVASRSQMGSVRRLDGGVVDDDGSGPAEPIDRVERDRGSGGAAEQHGNRDDRTKRRGSMSSDSTGSHLSDNYNLYRADRGLQLRPITDEDTAQTAHLLLVALRHLVQTERNSEAAYLISAPEVVLDVLGRAAEYLDIQMNGMVVILSVFRNRTVAVSACANVGLLRRLASLFLLSSVPQLVRLWCQVMFNLSAYAENHLALVKVGILEVIERKLDPEFEVRGVVPPWGYVCLTYRSFVFITLLLLNLSTNPTASFRMCGPLLPLLWSVIEKTNFPEIRRNILRLISGLSSAHEKATESFLAQRFLPLLLGYLEHETEAIVLQEVISILVAVDLSPALKTRVLMFSLSKLGANTEPEIANSIFKLVFKVAHDIPNVIPQVIIPEFVAVLWRGDVPIFVLEEVATVLGQVVQRRNPASADICAESLVDRGFLPLYDTYLEPFASKHDYAPVLAAKHGAVVGGGRGAGYTAGLLDRFQGVGASDEYSETSYDSSLAEGGGWRRRRRRGRGDGYGIGSNGLVSGGQRSSRRRGRNEAPISLAHLGVVNRLLAALPLLLESESERVVDAIEDGDLLPSLLGAAVTAQYVLGAAPDSLPKTVAHFKRMVSLFLEVLRGMIATMPLYVLHTLERGSAAVDFVSLCFELLESEDEGDAAIAAEALLFLASDSATHATLLGLGTHDGRYESGWLFLAISSAIKTAFAYQAPANDAELDFDIVRYRTNQNTVLSLCHLMYDVLLGVNVEGAFFAADNQTSVTLILALLRDRLATTIDFEIKTSPVVLAMVSLFWLLSPLEKHALVVVDSGGVEALSSVLERGYEARRLRLAACGTLLNLSRFASCRALLVEHAALHPVLFRIVQSFWSVDIGLMILGFYLNVTEDAPSEKALASMRALVPWILSRLVSGTRLAARDNVEATNSSDVGGAGSAGPAESNVAASATDDDGGDERGDGAEPLPGGNQALAEEAKAELARIGDDAATPEQVVALRLSVARLLERITPFRRAAVAATAYDVTTQRRKFPPGLISKHTFEALRDPGLEQTYDPAQRIVADVDALYAGLREREDMPIFAPSYGGGSGGDRGGGN